MTALLQSALRPLLFTLALLSGAHAGAVPSGTWRWLQPKVTGANLTDVAFVDAGRGCAVGSGSTVLCTTDGGTTWRIAATPPGPDLKSVARFGTRVVAAGANATLLRSDDDGATFTTVAWRLVGSRPTLIDVQFLDENNGFLLADDGTLVGTTDGFRTIYPVTRIGTFQPHALWFADTRKGWIAGGTTNGSVGTVWQTSDGGSTFQQATQTSGGPLRAIAGATIGGAEAVVACGAATPRCTYLNGAQPANGWQPLDPGGEEITSLSLKTDPSGNPTFELWGAAASGLWVARSDGSPMQEPFQQTSPRLASVSSRTYGIAVAVGEGGTIVQGGAGGEAAVLTGNRSENLSLAAFTTDGLYGLLLDAGTSGSRVLATKDGGGTLVPVGTLPGNVGALALVDVQNAFAATLSGDFYVSTNGGAQWQRRSSLPRGTRSLAFVDARNGYAAGDGGLVVTIDGGTSWRPVLVTPMLAVAANARTAVAIGASGEVQRRFGPDPLGAWSAVSQPQTGITLTSLALFSDGRLAYAGRNATGPFLHLETSTAAVDTSTSALILGLVTAADRLFARMEGGRLAEVQADGTLTSELATMSDVNGIASRTAPNAQGTIGPAPVVFGRSGILLAFEDAPEAPNQLPVITLGASRVQVVAGGSGQLSATVVDGDGETVTVRWSEPSGTQLTFATPDALITDVTWTSQPTGAARTVARLTACDPRGGCSIADVIVTTDRVANRAPRALADGASVLTGQRLILDSSGSYDPDGDLLSRAWRQLSGAAATLSGPADGPVLYATAPSTAGVLLFELTVCDPSGQCGRTEVTVSVYAPGTNAPPIASTQGDLFVPPASRIVLDASNSYDPEDNRITSAEWRQVGGPAVPLTNATNLIASAAAGAEGDRYRFVVKVCDRQAACTEAFVNVTITSSASPNLAPQIVLNRSRQSAGVGDNVVLSASAVDPEGFTLTPEWKDDQPVLGILFKQVGNGDVSFVVPPGASGTTLRFRFVACDPDGACSTAFDTVTVTGPPPLTADAGPDQRVPGGARVVLDATGSKGTITAYAWTQLSGPPVALAGADQSKALFTAPDEASTLVFRLTVTGADGTSAATQVTITVTGPLAPIADAGADQTVGFGARVQLDARRTTDPLSRAVTYAWTAPDGIALAGADSELAAFYAAAAPASLTFTLTVCARANVCGTDQVTITVAEGENLPPLPNAGLDRRAMSGSSLTLDGTASLDPEGTPLTARWSSVDGLATPQLASGLWSPVTLPIVTEETPVTFQLDVCDAAGSCGNDRVTITVLPVGPETPTISARIVDHDDGLVPEQSLFTVELTATCPGAPCVDGGRVRQLSGIVLGVTPAPLDFATPRVFRAQPFTLEASVCDAAGRCAVQTVEGTVTNDRNEPPVAVAPTTLEARRRQQVILDASASHDLNAEPLSFSWRQSDDPTTVTLVTPSSDRARFTVPADAPSGAMRFEVTVCDLAGDCSSATTEVTILDGDPANRPPVAYAGADRQTPVGAPVRIDGRGSFDPDGDALSYEWSIVAGTGATVAGADQPTATIVFAEPVSAESPLLVQLRVCDPAGACGTDQVAVSSFLLPTSDVAAQAQFSAPQATSGCGCTSGEPAHLLAALLAFATLARRRSRR